MIPHYPEMVARLLDEPYTLTMESISGLTAKQITELYFRPRDEKGIALPIPYAFDDGEREREKAVAMLSAIAGISEEEARRKIHGD